MQYQTFQQPSVVYDAVWVYVGVCEGEREGESQSVSKGGGGGLLGGEEVIIPSWGNIELAQTNSHSDP